MVPGPSHDEEWHNKRITLVTTRSSGSSYLNKVELMNGCIAHSNPLLCCFVNGCKHSGQAIYEGVRSNEQFFECRLLYLFSESVGGCIYFPAIVHIQLQPLCAGMNCSSCKERT